MKKNYLTTFRSDYPQNLKVELIREKLKFLRIVTSIETFSSFMQEELLKKGRIILAWQESLGRSWNPACWQNEKEQNPEVFEHSGNEDCE